MKRVEAGGEWSLLCPNECPGLVDSWGDEFERLYAAYPSPSPTTHPPACTAFPASFPASSTAAAACPSTCTASALDRYEKYEAEGKARRSVKAQELWFAILDAQSAPRLA